MLGVISVFIQIDAQGFISVFIKTALPAGITIFQQHGLSIRTQIHGADFIALFIIFALPAGIAGLNHHGRIIQIKKDAFLFIAAHIIFRAPAGISVRMQHRLFICTQPGSLHLQAVFIFAAPAGISLFHQHGLFIRAQMHEPDFIALFIIFALPARISAGLQHGLCILAIEHGADFIASFIIIALPGGIAIISYHKLAIRIKMGHVFHITHLIRLVHNAGITILDHHQFTIQAEEIPAHFIAALIMLRRPIAVSIRMEHRFFIFINVYGFDRAAAVVIFHEETCDAVFLQPHQLALFVQEYFLNGIAAIIKFRLTDHPALLIDHRLILLTEILCTANVQIFIFICLSQHADAVGAGHIIPLPGSRTAFAPVFQIEHLAELSVFIVFILFTGCAVAVRGVRIVHGIAHIALLLHPAGFIIIFHQIPHDILPDVPLAQIAHAVLFHQAGVHMHIISAVILLGHLQINGLQIIGIFQPAHGLILAAVFGHLFQAAQGIIAVGSLHRTIDVFGVGVFHQAAIGIFMPQLHHLALMHLDGIAFPRMQHLFLRHFPDAIRHAPAQHIICIVFRVRRVILPVVHAHRGSQRQQQGAETGQQGNIALPAAGIAVFQLGGLQAVHAGDHLDERCARSGLEDVHTQQVPLPADLLQRRGKAFLLRRFGGIHDEGDDVVRRVSALQEIADFIVDVARRIMGAARADHDQKLGIAHRSAQAALQLAGRQVQFVQEHRRQPLGKPAVAPQQISGQAIILQLLLKPQRPFGILSLIADECIICGPRVSSALPHSFIPDHGLQHGIPLLIIFCTHCRAAKNARAGNRPRTFHRFMPPRRRISIPGNFIAQ